MNGLWWKKYKGTHCKKKIQHNFLADGCGVSTGSMTNSPMEYLSMSGMKARSCACVIFSTGVGMPSMMSGGSSNSDGSSSGGGGACGHPPSPNWRSLLIPVTSHPSHPSHASRLSWRLTPHEFVTVTTLETTPALLFLLFDIFFLFLQWIFSYSSWSPIHWKN